jgi:hypothetical protein
MRVFDQSPRSSSQRKDPPLAARCSLPSSPGHSRFITSRPRKRKGLGLIEQGYGGDPNNEAYNSIMFRSNLSVRATDEFLDAGKRTASGPPALLPPASPPTNIQRGN